VSRRRSNVSCVDVYEYSLESGDLVSGLTELFELFDIWTMFLPCQNM
jgi:hypothetical protein